MKYLVKTSLGNYLFDENFNYVDSSNPMELGVICVHIEERHLFVQEDIEENFNCYEPKNPKYIEAIKRSLVSQMVNNSIESLVAAETVRRAYSYYDKIKHRFPNVIKAISELIPSAKPRE